MRKQLFFVTTHGSLYSNVFPLINERKEHGQIILIVINDKLEQFLREYTNFKIIRLKVNPNLITKSTKHKLLSNIIKSKIEYNKILKYVHDADVHFFTCSYAIIPFSYIKKLTKHNTVYYYGKGTPRDVHPIKNGILPFVMKMIPKIFLNVEVDIVDSETNLVCTLHEKFYKNITKLPNTVFDTSVNNKYIRNISQLDKKNILLLSSNITNTCGFVTNDEAIRITNIVMDAVNDRRDECIIKCHPVDNNKVYGKMHELNGFIPSHIPAEFLSHHNWEFVIGIVSTSLILFSEQSKIKVVSMIKMMEIALNAERSPNLKVETTPTINIISSV